MSRYNTLYNVIPTSRPFKRLTFAEAALRLRGGIILGLLAAGLISSAAGQQADTDTATSLKAHPGWVRIPGALIRPDCVHEIPNGADVVISDNKITGDVTLGGVLVAHYDPCPEAPVITRPHEGGSQTVTGVPTCPPPPAGNGTGNGWVEALPYQVPLSSGDIDYLYGTWTVPTNPSANGGLIYLFNGVVSSDKNWILQPVLQWGADGTFGGNYWVIASWLVGNCGSYVFHSPAERVSPGHTIVGATWITSASSGTLQWEVYTSDQTSGAYSWITAHSTGLQWNWAYAGVLEAYGITSCPEFPETPGGTWFQNSALYTGYPNYTYTPAYWYGAWGNYYGWSGPYCGFSATPNSGGGLLTYY
jgi:hypothetical protein